MRAFFVLLVGLMLAGGAQAAGPGRFVVDDDTYVDKILVSCAKLRAAGKLKTAAWFRGQDPGRAAVMRPGPLSAQRLSPPDLYEHLRQSTFAVGSYYLCPECHDWHFTSGSGFVAGENGVLCTCWHVIAAQDEGVKEAYLVAADSEGRVFPLESLLAVDKEADTCLVKIAATGLKPLPVRTGVRPGERVYCLSHPGGFYFMFTEGIVARLNRRPNEVLDAQGHFTDQLTRPVLFLNVTAEFAPGSSGAPVVDELGNLVGQVASIAEAGEPSNGDDKNPPSPSVSLRFCTASEEILHFATTSQPALPTKAPIKKHAPHVR